MTSAIAPVAAELDKQEEFSAALTRKMGEIGLFGMFVSQAYEGQEMDYLSYIVAVEEIARVCASHAVTVVTHTSNALGPIYDFGNEEQKKRYLPAVAAGDIRFLTVAATEPDSGANMNELASTARRDGGADPLLPGRDAAQQCSDW